MITAVLFVVFCFAVSVLSKPSIILVGMSKGGTSSFHQLFLKMRLKSAHYAIGRNYTPMATLIKKADSEGKPLLHYMEDFDAVSEINNVDVGCYFPQLDPVAFRKLTMQYPDAVYIFNTRSVAKQVRSMMSYWDGGWANLFHTQCKEYLKDYKGNQLAVTTQFVEHFNQVVRDFFANATVKYLEFNIEQPEMVALNRFIDTKGLPFPMANKNPALVRLNAEAFAKELEESMAQVRELEKTKVEQEEHLEKAEVC